MLAIMKTGPSLTFFHCVHDPALLKVHIGISKMEWSSSSWFRRSISRSSSSTNKNTLNPDRQKHPNPRTLPAEDDEKLLGITDQLVDHVKSFCIDTFKKFPLQDEVTRRTAAAASSAVPSDLSEWQERHATLVLSKVKELAQLRFMLCPEGATILENIFCVLSTFPSDENLMLYELRAVQVAKLRRMAMENEEPSDTTSAFEVEMGETRKGVAIASSAP